MRCFTIIIIYLEIDWIEHTPSQSNIGNIYLVIQENKKNNGFGALRNPCLDSFTDFTIKQKQCKLSYFIKDLSMLPNLLNFLS